MDGVMKTNTTGAAQAHAKNEGAKGNLESISPFFILTSSPP
jgi:hypothetical protein